MGVLENVPNSSCLEHLRFSYVYGFALFPFSWLSSILGFTEFSWKSGETALWSYRAAREIGRTFMWGFGHHTPWRMAYMWGGLFFQGRLAFIFWRRWTSFPSPPILKARLPLSPSHMDMPFSSQVCHPLRSYIYSRSFGILFFLFLYFLIFLFLYIFI